MTSMELDFGSEAAASIAQKKIDRLVDDAVASVGLGTAAGACGCTPAQLRDAIDGRNGRRLPTMWALRIAKLAGGQYRDSIQDAINEFIDPGPVATDAQYIAALVEAFESFGDQGKAVLAHVRRRAKR